MSHVLHHCCGCVCSHQPPTSISEAVSPSEAFYDQLQLTLFSVPSSDLQVIMGNFNAHVDSVFPSLNSIIGPYGIGECNENGECLLDFCASNQLIITNTWFRSGNRSRIGHMMDDALINKHFRTNVTHVSRSTFHESDHELVMSALHFEIKAKCRHTGTPHYQTTNVPTSHQSWLPVSLG